MPWLLWIFEALVVMVVVSIVYKVGHQRGFNDGLREAMRIHRMKEEE